jgi:hypothetical protein
MSLDGLRALPFVQRGNGLSLVFNKKGLEDWSKLTRFGARRLQTNISERGGAVSLSLRHQRSRNPTVGEIRRAPSHHSFVRSLSLPKSLVRP